MGYLSYSLQKKKKIHSACFMHSFKTVFCVDENKIMLKSAYYIYSIY